MAGSPPNSNPKAPPNSQNSFGALTSVETQAKVGHFKLTWVKVPVGEQTTDLDDSDVVDNHGVPKELLFQFVHKEMQKEESLISLPWAILFLVVYANILFSHHHSEIIGDVEHAISTDLHENSVFAYTDPGFMAHKDLSDVNNAQDIFSWLRVGLCPLLFRNFHVWSEIYGKDERWPDKVVSEEERSFYLQYNRLIGGVQLTQTRGEPTTCPNPDLADILNAKCNDGDEVLDLNLHIEPEPLQIKTSNFLQKADPKFDIFFLFGEDPENVNMRLRQMELSNWIDNKTISVGAHFMSYNAHFDVITRTSMMFFFSRSGKMWRKILHSSLVVHPYKDPLTYAWDGIFSVMLISLLIREATEIFVVFKESKTRRKSQFFFIKQYVDVWNMVDWLSIVVGAVLVVMWAQHSLFNMRTIREQVKLVAENDKGRFGGFASLMVLETLVRDMFTAFHQTESFVHYVRIIASLYPIVLMMRLFKAFNAQPRLAIVTRTIYTAGRDLLHFCVIFIATFLPFTLMAHGLFAREIVEFRTWGRSFSTCFDALVGDWDLSDMKKADRTMTLIWFCSFQVTMTLVLLNMLLAIIMDVYTDVKGRIHQAQGINEEIAKVLRRWKQNRRGHRLTLRKIKKFLACHSTWRRNSTSHHSDDSEHIFFVKHFVDCAPGLKEEQARRLMVNAVQAFRLEHEEKMTIHHALRAILNIQKHVFSLEELKKARHKQSHPEPNRTVSTLSSFSAASHEDAPHKVHQQDEEQHPPLEMDLGQHMISRLEALESTQNECVASITKLDSNLQKFEESQNLRMDRLEKLVLQLVDKKEQQMLKFNAADGTRLQI